MSKAYVMTVPGNRGLSHIATADGRRKSKPTSIMSTNAQASHGEVLSIELASLGPPISQTEELRRAEATALPPIDGGVKAWTFVFSSFVLEALVWGFAFR